MSDLVIANKSDFVAVANKIREKTGSTNELSFPNGFIGEIDGISGSGSGGGYKVGIATCYADDYITFDFEPTLVIALSQTTKQLTQSSSHNIYAIQGELADVSYSSGAFVYRTEQLNITATHGLDIMFDGNDVWMYSTPSAIDIADEYLVIAIGE